jgi:hypothetical protein
MCVPLLDDASSDRSSQSHVASPAELSDVPTDSSFSVTVMCMGGRRRSILVWDEEEDGFNVDEESECHGNDGTNGSYLAVAGSTSRMSRLRNLGSSRVPLRSISIPLTRSYLAGGKVISGGGHLSTSAWPAGRRARAGG